jgi:hypothetical protein
VFEILAAAPGVFIQSYSEAKLGLEQSIPFDADWLHLAIGPAILLFAAAVLRKPLSSWVPWLVVAAIALVNETVDLANSRVAPGAAYCESTTDFLLTMAIPTLMLVVARFAARTAQRPR